MATIINTAVKLLLDSSGFSSGVAQAVAVVNSAKQQMEATQVSPFGEMLEGAVVGSLRAIASALNDIHPALGWIASAAASAAANINMAAVAQSIWTAGVHATAFAVGVLEAIGLPLFAAIGVLLAAAAAAGWALHAALSAVAGTTEEIKELSASEEQAKKTLEQWFESMGRMQMTAGMDEQQKQLYEINALLAKRFDMTRQEKEIALATAEADIKRLARIKEELALKAAALKHQQDVAKTMDDVQKQIEQFDMTPMEKALADFADRGATPEEQQALLEKLRILEEMRAARQREKDLAEETAKAEREAEEAAKAAARAREEAARREEQARRNALREAAQEAQELARNAERDVRDAEGKVRALEGAGASGSTTNAPKFINAGSAEADLERTRTKPFERLTQIQQQQLEEARRQLEELKRIAEAAAAAAEEARRQANF